MTYRSIATRPYRSREERLESGFREWLPTTRPYFFRERHVHYAAPVGEGPKPSDAERKVLALIWKHYQRTGEWAPSEQLQREVDRGEDHLDLWEIISAISSRLAVRSWGNERGPSVRVRGVVESGEPAPELEEFTKLASLCVERYLSMDAKAELTRADLAQDDFSAQKAARLLAGEGFFISSLPDTMGPDWRSEVNWHGARQFKRMGDLATYLDIEDEVAPRRQAAIDSISGAGALGVFAPHSAASDVLRALLPDNVGNEVLPAAQAARARFDQATTDEARRSAVRDLAALLESLRSQLDEALPFGKDNRALFEIANNYFIRHWNEKQLMAYDSLWLTWIFNLFESTFYTWLGFVIRSRRRMP